ARPSPARPRRRPAARCAWPCSCAALRPLRARATAAATGQSRTPRAGYSAVRDTYRRPASRTRLRTRRREAFRSAPPLLRLSNGSVAHESYIVFTGKTRRTPSQASSAFCFSEELERSEGPGHWPAFSADFAVAGEAPTASANNWL